MIDWQSLRDTIGILSLLRLAKLLKLDTEKCLVGTRLELSSLEKPFACVRAWQELTVIRNLQLLVPATTNLGMMLAPYYRINDLGILGLGMASCYTVEQAFLLVGAYNSFGLSFSEITVKKCKGVLTIELNDNFVPPDCKAFCIDRGLILNTTYVRELANQDFIPEHVEMRTPAPVESDKHTQFFGIPVKYSSDKNLIRFQRGVAETKLPTANKKTKLLCEYYCQEIRDIQTRETELDFCIRTLLTQHNFKLSSSEIAEKLGISPRTLRRHLAEQGKTLRQLTTESKIAHAQTMLEEGHPIKKVAQFTGYTESASFTRAFKSFSGVTPGNYARNIRTIKH